MSSKRQEEDEYDSDEDNNYTQEDVNEMRAFMRVFMDLVGIFSDEQSPSQGVHTSSGIPFGMANVGSLPSDGVDEWSTEDDDDDEDDDSDQDDAEENIFEPMAKSYYHMNLKESVGQERSDGERYAEEEARRKLKNAKKKTEKRRKQKEKKMKMKMTAERQEEEEKLRAREEQVRLQQEEQARQRKEELKRAQEDEARRRTKLFDDAAHGHLQQLCEVLDRNIMKCTERTSEGGKSGAGLVHYAIAPPNSSSEEMAQSTEARLKVVNYLLHLKSPGIDLSILDDAGRNVLHLSSKVGDIKFVDVILNVRGESHERRNQLDLNAHCLNLGYTALHYATEGGRFEVCSRLIDSGVLLNIHATYIAGISGTTGDGSDIKGPTPLDLANLKVIENGLSDSKKEEYRNIIEKLTKSLAKIESARIAKEKERVAKEAKLKADKEAQLLKEQEEKELADRKQRQLREKQEKIARMRDAAESVTVDSAAHIAAADNAPNSASKKKKKDKKKPPGKKGSEIPVSSLDSASLRANEAVQSSRHQSSAGPQRPRADSNSSTGSGGLRPSELQPEEMRSKGELLNHLLAMGFPEEQCLAAISACGLNADVAISWIVDRPEAAAAATGRTAKVAAPKPAVTAASVNAENAARTEAELKKKAQEEKEKLRRINREWNAKVPQQRAEEERRKAQQEQEARIESERKKTTVMLAPHLKFPPDIYPQTLDQAFGPGVVYAPGMPPPAAPPQYGVASTYPYMNGQYPMQQSPGFMGPPGMPPPSFISSGRSGGTNTAGTLAPDGSGVAFPLQTRMQSWPAAGSMNGTSSTFTPAPGLPLATGLTPVKAPPSSMYVPTGSNNQFSAPSGGVTPSSGNGIVFPGRSRGPGSPRNYQGFSHDFVASPEQAPMGSPSSPGHAQQQEEPQYSDGALELSVSAREFVPKFGPTAMSPVTTTLDASLSGPAQPQGIMGMGGLWNSGTVGAEVSLKEHEGLSAPPIMFPSDLRGSSGMGFDGIGSWVLSDSMDLQIPLEQSGLGLSSSLGGGMGSRFGEKFDDDDGLDMDAALLGSDILGRLDDTDDLTGVGRGKRQSSSFLSTLGINNSDLGSSSSGFSSMFGNRDGNVNSNNNTSER